MTTQLVKKFGGKRKGYKGWQTAKDIGKGVAGTAASWGLTDFIISVLNAMPAGKDGGRVTKRGIGKAKRGLGKVMGKK